MENEEEEEEEDVEEKNEKELEDAAVKHLMRTKVGPCSS